MFTQAVACASFRMTSPEARGGILGAGARCPQLSFAKMVAPTITHPSSP